MKMTQLSKCHTYENVTHKTMLKNYVPKKYDKLYAYHENYESTHATSLAVMH